MIIIYDSARVKPAPATRLSLLATRHSLLQFDGQHFGEGDACSAQFSVFLREFLIVVTEEFPKIVRGIVLEPILHECVDGLIVPFL